MHHYRDVSSNMPPMAAIKCRSVIRSLSYNRSLSLLQIMTSNDNNDKRKLEEEADSSMVRKRLRLSNDDTSDDDSSDSPEEEVSSEETSMNQLDTSEKKLQAKRARGIIFGNNDDTT
jgi:hypothetical protein